MAKDQPSPSSAPDGDGRPLFWQHAIQECNEAHAALDRLGAPKTKTVPRIRGEGDQEIAVGLRDRIMSIPWRQDGDGRHAQIRRLIAEMRNAARVHRVKPPGSKATIMELNAAYAETGDVLMQWANRLDAALVGAEEKGTPQDRK